MPSGAKARARANIAAIELLRAARGRRPATAVEQRVLAAWSGWGAVPEVFDPRNETLHGRTRRLRDLLPREQYPRAEASVLNAHYTDPAVARIVWDALRLPDSPEAVCSNRVVAAAHSSAMRPPRR